MMGSLIYTSNIKHAVNDYIIFPVSGELRVTINKNKNLIDPLVTVSGNVNTLNFRISSDQYHGILDFFDWIRIYHSRIQYISLQQFKPIPSKDNNALNWWFYAFRCIRKDVQDKNKIWNEQILSQRRNDRIKYRINYDKQQKGKQLLSDEKALIDKVERNYSVSELILFRKCPLPIEKKESIKEAPPVKKDKGFFETFSSFFDNESSEKAKEESESITSLINWEDLIVESNNKYPPKYIQTQFSFKINTFSFEILDNQNYKRIVYIASEKLDYEAKFRQDWYSFKFDMLKIKAIDYFTCHEQKNKLLILETKLDQIQSITKQPKYFSLEFDLNPIQENLLEKLDARIRVISQSIIFTYSSILFKQLRQDFFPHNRSSPTVLGEIYNQSLELFTLEVRIL